MSGHLSYLTSLAQHLLPWPPPHLADTANSCNPRGSSQNGVPLSTLQEKRTTSCSPPHDHCGTLRPPFHLSPLKALCPASLSLCSLGISFPQFKACWARLKPTELKANPFIYLIFIIRCNLAPHLHHLKSLSFFSYSYFVCLAQRRCYLKNEYVNTWPIRLPKRGLWVLRAQCGSLAIDGWRWSRWGSYEWTLSCFCDHGRHDE